MKKTLLIVAILLLVALVGYKSVYFRKLDERNAGAVVKAFDPASYASTYLFGRLPALLAKRGAVADLGTVLASLDGDPQVAFKRFGKCPDGGNTWYFLAKGRGRVKSADESSVTVDIGGARTIKLATAYIFGNAARDASGLVDHAAFNSTMELNDVSEAINKLLKSKVAPGLKAKARTGADIGFAGCFELKMPDAGERVRTAEIDIIPVSVSKTP